MMQGPCEHCGNSDKSKWTTQCTYKGDWPSHRAFVLSMFDPPCACEAYDEGQRKRVRQNNITAMRLTFGAAVVIGLIWFLIKQI